MKFYCMVFLFTIVVVGCSNLQQTKTTEEPTLVIFPTATLDIEPIQLEFATRQSTYPTSIQTPTQELVRQLPTSTPTSTINIPTFIILNQEIQDTVTRRKKDAPIPEGESLPYNHNAPYKVTKLEKSWEISNHNGKKIAIHVIDRSQGFIRTEINTTELAGKESVFVITTPEGAVLTITIIGFYKYNDYVEAFLFAPSINEFVMCPSYNSENWFCIGTDFFIDGSLYVNLMVSKSGSIIFNPTRLQLENIAYNLNLENGNGAEPKANWETVFLAGNEGRWCGRKGDNKVRYKLPNSEDIYEWGYNKCPFALVEPFVDPLRFWQNYNNF